MKNNRKKEDYFTQLYYNTYQGLRRYVQRVSAVGEIVDDILQEVYLEAFRHVDDLIAHENSIGWLYKTADNKSKKLNSIYYKHIVHETEFEEGMSDYLGKEDTSDLLMFDEYKNILREDEYALLMKRYNEGYSHKEIAEMTGNTLAGSKMKISRIKQKLQKNLNNWFTCVLLFLIFEEL